MKRDDMVGSIAMRLKILHLQDFNQFMDGELPLLHLLDKLADSALETVELEGMLPPPDYSIDVEGTSSIENYPNQWENEDEPS